MALRFALVHRPVATMEKCWGRGSSSSLIWGWKAGARALHWLSRFTTRDRGSRREKNERRGGQRTWTRSLLTASHTVGPSLVRLSSSLFSQNPSLHLLLRSLPFSPLPFPSTSPPSSPNTVTVSPSSRAPSVSGSRIAISMSGARCLRMR